MKPAEAPFNVHWTFSRFKIMSLRRGDLMGHRHGKTKEQKEHHIAHNLRRRCITRGFEGIHDRFQNDPIFRESQLRIDRTEEVCIQRRKERKKERKKERRTRRQKTGPFPQPHAQDHFLDRVCGNPSLR